MALAVRPAAPGDVEGLAEVHVRCWQETYQGMLSQEFLAAQNSGTRLPLWRHLLESAEPAEAWVASDGGTLVGFAGIRREPGAASHSFEPPSSGDLELWGLYLLASHQGLGLGRRLLEAALGDEPASLWVAAHNAPAISFYRHFGFAPDGAADVIPEWENLREIRMVRPRQAAFR
ncbi:ribosomal protein S18 acetylase RimI-like enzyme [Arthrobacter sp. SLBN-100]|nr:ribosomal protein S18 acetylase RimI-like enzyme [Arthrobacter sp. SLBN-100]